MKKYVLSLLCIFIAAFLFAQDKIIKIDGTEILCHVKEIGTSEIKYTKADNPDGPIYTINKTEVRKIIFANGTEEVITQNEMSVTPNAMKRMYKRAITTRPFSPLQQFICLGYQQALTPTRAIVAEVGFIGPTVGSIWPGDPQGGYIKVGFRMKRTPEVVMPGMEWGYNLGGFYVQPELAFASFNVTETGTYYNSQGQPITSTEVNRYNSGAFLICLGRQMIVGDIVTFDLGGAVGYGYTDKPEFTWNNFDTRIRYYSHTMIGKNFPMAWKFTFSMGIMLR